jgi:CIC family chloride channel protein
VNKLFRTIQLSENSVMFVIAALIGALTALALWIFRLGIEACHHIFQDFLGHEVLGGIAPIGMVITLALAGLIVGWIVHTFVGHEKYHGVSLIIESVALTGGKLRWWKMPFKAFASVISLGAGASVGPEDPSVQIGANIGSLLGGRFRLNEDTVRLLVAAGGASAVSAAFNAPIAGVFFALEVILVGELLSSSVGVVIIAAVISSAVTRGLGIDEAALGPFSFTLNSALEFPYYLPLGVILAPCAIIFMHSVYWQRGLWHRVIRLPLPLKTALAGGIVGVIGIFLPEILGGGREIMNDVLHGDLTMPFLLLIVIAGMKIVATSISLAGGFVGGVFAPSLFIGTMIGMAYGNFLSFLLDGRGGDPRNYAIAGMAGMMAGVVRSPITAIMMVFELTNDYRFILPIMLVVAVCIFIAEKFEPHGIYQLALVRNGINLRPGRDVDVMQGITVGEAMSKPAPSISHKAHLTDLRDTFRTQHRNALCVLDESGDLCGIVTLSDLQNAFQTPETAVTLRVGDICTRTVMTAHADDVLWKAIKWMGARNIGRLPVLDDEEKLVGMLNRDDIVSAYNTAIERKVKDQQQVEQIRLNTLTGAHVYELHISGQCKLAGMLIKDVQWPPEAVVASVMRKGRLVVPNGSTLLRVGDTLSIVADPHIEKSLRALFAQLRDEDVIWG